MRRAPIVITATVVGTAGVLLFKPLPVSSLEALSSSDGSSSSGSSSSSTGSSSSSSASSDSSGAEPTTAPSSGSTSSTSSSSSKTSTANATVKGDVETDRYGDTQVEVTIKGGKITEVTVLAYNDDDPRSAQISQSAITVSNN